MRLTLPFFRFWKPLVIGLFILILCLIPSSELSKIDFLKINYEDLAVHLIMFVTFSALLYYDLRKYSNVSGNRMKIALMVMCTSLFLGISTEMFQLIFTTLNRTASMMDFMLDFAGTIAGIILMRFIMK